MQQAPVLTSAADPASEAWQANEAAHHALTDELRKRLATARLGGGEKARARHVARGKLLPRERVDTLLDRARPSWSWPRWRPRGCTGARHPPPG